MLCCESIILFARYGSSSMMFLFFVLIFIGRNRSNVADILGVAVLQLNTLTYTHNQDSRKGPKIRELQIHVFLDPNPTQTRVFFQ